MPTAICQNITLQLDATGNATITAADVDNGSTDNCGIANLTIDITSFDCSDVGPNTVNLTVTDDNGNTNTCTATVTVEDNIAPIITCPADIIVNTCSMIVTYVVTSSDNCSGEIITQTDLTGYTSGDTFPVGTTTLEYTVTDASGNTAVCTFNVTVNDTLFMRSEFKGGDIGVIDTILTFGYFFYLLFLSGLLVFILNSLSFLRRGNKLIDVSNNNLEYVVFSTYVLSLIIIADLHYSIWSAKSILPLIFFCLAINERGRRVVMPPS